MVKAANIVRLSAKYCIVKDAYCTIKQSGHTGKLLDEERCSLAVNFTPPKKQPRSIAQETSSFVCPDSLVKIYSEFFHKNDWHPPMIMANFVQAKFRLRSFYFDNNL